MLDLARIVGIFTLAVATINTKQRARD